MIRAELTPDLSWPIIILYLDDMELPNADFTAIRNQFPTDFIGPEDIALVKKKFSGQTHGILGKDLFPSSFEAGSLQYDPNFSYPVDGIALYQNEWYRSLISANQGNLPSDNGVTWELEPKLSGAIIGPWVPGLIITENFAVKHAGVIYGLKNTTTLPFLSAISPDLDPTNWEALGGTGGGAATIPAFVLFVGPTGDDGTAAIGDYTLPYATIKAAILAIPPFTEGYKIVVLPGLYDQSVNFQGSVDGNGKIINIEFMQGADILNTDTLSPYTFRIVEYSRLSVSGFPAIACQTSNSATHICVEFGETQLCEIKSISGDCANMFIGRARDGSVNDIGIILCSYNGAAVKGASVRGNGTFRCSFISISAATSGHALESSGGAGDQPIFDVGSITSTVDGIELQRPIFGHISSILSTLHCITTFTVITGAVFKVHYAESSSGSTYRGAFVQSNVHIERAISASQPTIDANETRESVVSFNYAEATAGTAVTQLNTYRECYIIGNIAKGSIYGVDLLAQANVITGFTYLRIKHIIGNVNGIRFQQGSASRLNSRVDIGNAIIESAGTPILINWIESTGKDQIFRLKDCQLIGAGDAIANVGGGVNPRVFDIQGYSVYSNLVINPTNLNVTALTQII